MMPIVYEAVQNGKPENKSGKGVILCSFTEKWYEFLPTNNIKSGSIGIITQSQDTAVPFPYN
jgi:phosphoribosylaminoimidazole-succinocarboxamide synthase